MRKLIYHRNFLKWLKVQILRRFKNSVLTLILNHGSSLKKMITLVAINYLIKALHKYAFMDLSKPIEEMIRCFKERKDFNEHDLKNWINCKSKHGYTALLFASFRGNVSTIIQLIKHGADINLSNNEGLNVIHMASQGNQAASIVYFKEKYKIDIMSVDAYGSTPLHWACYTGSEQAFNFLISYKVDINLQDNQGLTPLHLAIVSGIII